MKITRHHTIIGLEICVGIAASSSIAASVWAIDHYNQVYSNATAKPPNLNADAIIVFTGSKARIRTFFKLREQNKNRAYISGTSINQSVKDLCHSVDLDYKNVNTSNVECSASAQDTRGNALDLKNWLYKHSDVKSVLIITGSQQLPRAYEEVRRVIPKGLVDISFLGASDDGFKQYINEIGKLAARTAGIGTRKAPLRDNLAEAPSRQKYVMGMNQ